MATDVLSRIENSGDNIKNLNDEIKLTLTKRRSEIKNYYDSLRKVIDEQEVINLAEITKSQHEA